MKPSAESLTERYSRLDALDLQAIVDAPEGEYLPDAVDAARTELANRALMAEDASEPAAPPDEPCVRQSRVRTIFAFLVIFVGMALLVPAVLLLVSAVLAPSWDRVLWGGGLLFAGLAVSYLASVFDRAFWEHAMQGYAVAGFLKGASSGAHLAFGTGRSADGLLGILQGSLMVGLALAVMAWRRRLGGRP